MWGAGELNLARWGAATAALLSPGSCSMTLKCQELLSCCPNTHPEGTSEVRGPVVGADGRGDFMAGIAGLATSAMAGGGGSSTWGTCNRTAVSPVLGPLIKVFCGPTNAK